METAQYQAAAGGTDARGAAAGPCAAGPDTRLIGVGPLGGWLPSYAVRKCVAEPMRLAPVPSGG